MGDHNAVKKPAGILNVKVVRAIKLKKKGLLGAPHPYVKLNLADNKLRFNKTSVKHKNLEPEWNEEFSIFIKDPESQALELSLYDWKVVGLHYKMGMNIVPLKALTPEEPRTMTLDLLKNLDSNDVQNKNSRGRLVIEINYKPFKDNDVDSDVAHKAPEGTPSGGGGVLVIVVDEARDLQGKNHTNPSIRLLFRSEDRKTKVCKRNRDPRWREEFQFVLDEPPTNDKVHVEVVSTSTRVGLIHPKEALGYVDIYLSDVVNNRRTKEVYRLIDSKNGRIQIEMQWRPA